jgi:hypothetical protein
VDEPVGNGAELPRELLLVGRTGPGAGEDQRPHAVRKGEGEVEGDAATHREPAEGGALNAEVIQQLAQVLDRGLLGVVGEIQRHRGRRISPAVVDHDSVVISEDVDLSPSPEA